MNNRILQMSMAEIMETVELQDALLQHLGEAMVVITPLGIITRFSSAAEKIFGYTADEVIGNNVSMLMPDEHGHQHDSYLTNASFSKLYRLGEKKELYALRKNRELFPVKITVTATEANGRMFYVGLIRDVTKEHTLNDSLVRALEDAQAASKAKSHFLANMSHEIRTPLNSILGTLQIIQQEWCEQAEGNAYANLVSRALLSGSGLLTIVNDILDTSKIEAGMLSLETIPFNCLELLETVQINMGVLAKEKDLNLVVKIQPDITADWLGDPVRVKQILVNLVSNGIKFTEHGSITMEITENRDADNSALCFCIADTGIGMSDEQIAKLFERFEQADDTITRRFGGTGLGMSIAHTLITMMGGTIQIDSKLGKGSRFYVCLPLTKATASLAQTAKPTHCVVPDLAGYDILLVEDNELNQIIVQHMLEPSKVNLRIAQNGKQALQNIQEQLPDLVLMDIQMPVMDGITACRLLKQTHPQLPVIALTANVMVEDIEKYQQTGFDAHCGKPIEMERLFSLLSEHLQTELPAIKLQ